MFLSIILVAKGVDVDTYDTNGLTPLMWAVLRSKGPDTVRVLLGLGADPNLVDRKFRNLPLHFAIETPRYCLYNTKMLILSARTHLSCFSK